MKPVPVRQDIVQEAAGDLAAAVEAGADIDPDQRIKKPLNAGYYLKRPSLKYFISEGVFDYNESI
jgi:hypothetical protein